MFNILNFFTLITSRGVLWTIVIGLIYGYQPSGLAQTPKPQILELKESVNQEIRLEVSLSLRQVKVYRGAEEIKKYPLGIGRSGWETPTGHFTVIQMVRDPVWMNPLTGQIVPATDIANPLGRFWIGFSVGGSIWYGFHSTNQPQTVGTSVSHGCLRMYSQDAEELFSQVKVGTPVIITSSLSLVD